MIPSDHARHICAYHEADEATVARAIEGALAAKAGWEAMPWNDRASIFLKAADLISKKYRYRLIAATILGQGKNAWQAEIDAAAEVGLSFKIFIDCRLKGRPFSLPTFSALVSSTSRSFTLSNRRGIPGVHGSAPLFSLFSHAWI